MTENKRGPDNSKMDTTNGSQQPLSMVAINNPFSHTDDDLLIIRVLESSERKMQLIKRLLTPGEYSSIASDLSSQNSLRELQVSSVPVQSTSGKGDQFRKLDNKKLSSSVCNLKHLYGSHNLHENLQRKREAIQFFFDEEDLPVRRRTNEGLPIELRAGHYLGTSSGVETVMKIDQSSLRDRILALLGWLGFSFPSLPESTSLNENEARFLEIHQTVNLLPYSRLQNVITMKDRLRSDGHLNTVLDNVDASKNMETTNEIVTGLAMSSHFNIAHSVKPIRFIQERLSLFIEHHQIVELFFEKLTNFVDLVKSALKLNSDELALEESSSGKESSSIIKSHELVDLLHGKIFKQDSAHLDFNSKLSRLINRVDLGFLVELLSGQKLGASYFVLDPLLDQIENEKNPNEDEGSKSNRLREALLTWRWRNNLSQPIHLSDQENIKAFCLQSDEIKSRVMQIMADKPESGYKLIEQLRKRAVDYIRHFETRLEETLQLDRERVASRRLRASRNNLAASLLVEPKLGRIHFGGAARLARKFAPRRTARRPLMPKRKRGTSSSGRAMSGMEHLDLESATSDDVEDPLAVERRFSSKLRQQAIANPVQLVISIRQAKNVPMRVVQRQVSSSPLVATRTSSPFLSSPLNQSLRPESAASPTNFMQTISSQLVQQQQQPSYLLAAPTTYVEMVFQRKQQASSLSHGRDPAWNETFFFPVDMNDTQSDCGATLLTNQQQLVDECLQLNLYGHYSYTVPSEDPISSEEAATLVLNSTLNGTQASTSTSFRQPPSNRTITSRQKIERNLLGSLRVPLITLLSNGRIEGSFALNQPLFLHDYQYELDQARGIFASTGMDSRPPETLVSLFITLNPPVFLPPQLYLTTNSCEGERLFEYARLWERVMFTVSGYCSRAAFRATTKLAVGGASGTHRRSRESNTNRFEPRRHIRTLILRSDARYCLICRLLMPLELPPQLEVDESVQGSSKQMRILARFVSLLSPLKHGLFSMRSVASSLWFDSSQLLNQCLGGSEEKAVLLCNYFLQLGKCSALLLGDSVEDGHCVYVIVWDDDPSELSINARDQLQLELADFRTESVRRSEVEAAQVATTRQPVNGGDLLRRMPILVTGRSVRLWNPDSGKELSLNYDAVQLTSVGSIVTMENVYANIQTTNNPAETDYDIRIRSSWAPLFETDHKIRLESLSANLGRSVAGRPLGRASGGFRSQLSQLEAMRKSFERPLMKPIAMAPINYDQLTLDQCAELQVAIERDIKASLLRCRPGRPTYFNRTLSRLLTDKLASFEASAQTMNSDGAIKHSFDWKNGLAELIRNEVLMAQHLSSGKTNLRQVVSWPANVPYTSMKAILDSLFASGVYNADLSLDDDRLSNDNRHPTSAQFIVACHVHPYPAHLVSLWIYVAAVSARERV